LPKEVKDHEPIIALDVATSHVKEMSGRLDFWFIDERADRVEHLRKELATRSIPPHFRVHAERGLFHEKVAQTLCLLLTLLITPVVYSYFDDLREWSPAKLFARLRGAGRPTPPAAESAG
jgi:hypothetical protein